MSKAPYEIRTCCNACMHEYRRGYMDKKHGLHFMRGRCRKERKQGHNGKKSPYSATIPQVLLYVQHCRGRTTFFFTGWTWRHVRVRPFSIAHKDHISTRTITDDRTISNLNSIRVRRTLSSVDKLVRETLCDRFHVAERRLAGLCHKNANENANANTVRTRSTRRTSTGLLTPMVRSAIAWFTLRRGDTSTA